MAILIEGVSLGRHEPQRAIFGTCNLTPINNTCVCGTQMKKLKVVVEMVSDLSLDDPEATPYIDFARDQLGHDKIVCDQGSCPHNKIQITI